MILPSKKRRKHMGKHRSMHRRAVEARNIYELVAFVRSAGFLDGLSIPRHQLVIDIIKGFKAIYREIRANHEDTAISRLRPTLENASGKRLQPFAAFVEPAVVADGPLRSVETKATRYRQSGCAGLRLVGIALLNIFHRNGVVVEQQPIARLHVEARSRNGFGDRIDIGAVHTIRIHERHRRLP